MQRFIHNENLKRFHDLLGSEKDPAKREQIERLLKEEEDRIVDPLQASPQMLLEPLADRTKTKVSSRGDIELSVVGMSADRIG